MRGLPERAAGEGKASPASAGGVAGFVLAGGESSRMGRDKALADFAGQPLIVRSLDILRRAGLEPAVAGSRSALEEFAPVIADQENGRGPLSGVIAGLESTSKELAVFLSVDLPLIPCALIAYLIRHSGVTGSAVTLASVNGYPQTFPVVIRRDTLPGLKAEFAAERRGCFSAFRVVARARGEVLSALPVEALVQAGAVAHPLDLQSLYWFLNVNSPAELSHAVGIYNRWSSPAKPSVDAMMEPDGRSQL